MQAVAMAALLTGARADAATEGGGAATAKAPVSSPAALESPGLRGPLRSGQFPGECIREDWKTNPPKARWRAFVGTGYSSVAVAGGLVYSAGWQPDDMNAKSVDGAMGLVVIRCLDLETGRERWKVEDLKVKHTSEGRTHATPAVSADRLFIFRNDGVLQCYDRMEGKLLWEDPRKLQICFDLSSSPLLFDGLVVVGRFTGENSSVKGKVNLDWVAFSQNDGKVRWHSMIDPGPALHGGSHSYGWCSAVPWTHAGARLILLNRVHGISAMDPATGAEKWFHPFNTPGTRFAPMPDPVANEDGVLITSSYTDIKRTARFVRIENGAPRETWVNDALGDCYSTPVIVGEHAYGYGGGRAFGSPRTFRCVALKDGAIAWERSLPRRGSKPADDLGDLGDGGNAIAADGLLIVQVEDGRVALVRADPTAFRPFGEVRPFNPPRWQQASRIHAKPGNFCKTSPVLVRGLLLCRDFWGELVCLDVGKP
jgi:outer membrane protein assembly factor BamB